MCRLSFAALLVTVASVAAADAPKTNTLPAKEISDGWVQLFDGKTTFGWEARGELRVEDGALVVTGAQPSVFTTATFGSDFEIRYDRYLENDDQYGETLFPRGISPAGGLGMGAAPKRTWQSFVVRSTYDPAARKYVLQYTDGPKALVGPTKFERALPAPPNVGIEFGIGDGKLRLRNVALRPLGLKSIFNGKDLSGWRMFTGDPKRAKSTFTVTPEGWLSVKDGPGDLQTEGKYGDFVFQGECISNGPHLNSGLFFRCIPDQYQNGYELQIRNQWEGDDRSKPVDFGTGAIYRRAPARRVVSSDGQWFTLTLIAHGNRFRSWVDGFPVVDWTDTRPENENPRQGLRRAAGHLSIQGHDPTTDLSFRNLRIAELKK